jgi:hypothetical protein
VGEGARAGEGAHGREREGVGGRVCTQEGEGEGGSACRRGCAREREGGTVRGRGCAQEGEGEGGGGREREGVTDLQGPPSERTQMGKIRDLKSLARQYARDQGSCDDTRISYLEFVESEAEADLTLARMIAG